MEALNYKEVDVMAEMLGMTCKQAGEIVEIFVNMFNEKVWNAPEKLNTLEDYIQEWEDFWFRYNTIQDLAKSENEQGVYGKEYYTVDNAIDELGKSIFKISGNLYIQCYK